MDPFLYHNIVLTLWNPCSSPAQPARAQSSIFTRRLSLNDYHNQFCLLSINCRIRVLCPPPVHVKGRGTEGTRTFQNRFSDFHWFYGQRVECDGRLWRPIGEDIKNGLLPDRPHATNPLPHPYLILQPLSCACFSGNCSFLVIIVLLLLRPLPVLSRFAP